MGTLLGYWMGGLGIVVVGLGWKVAEEGDEGGDWQAGGLAVSAGIGMSEDCN